MSSLRLHRHRAAHQSDFGFGFYDWHPKNAFDLYYDDLVLDVERVACSPR
jgi:hypothetical protein